MTPRRDDAPVTTGANVKTTTTLHPHRTPPVRLSLSLRRLLIEHFDAAVLYELAWLKQHDSPGMIARQSLSDASIDELADLLTAGRKASYGWWCRHLVAA